jgi:hypothetical protein
MKVIVSSLALLLVVAAGAGRADAAASPKKPTKYSVKGLSVSGGGGTSDGACLDTFVDVWAADEVTKGGSKTAQKYGYAAVSAYNYCTGEYTYAFADLPAPTLTGTLKGAAVSASFTQAEKCYWDPDLQQDVCETVALAGTVSAKFTATGTTYKGRDSYSSSSQYYRIRSTYSGTSTDATVDFAGTVLDGVAFVPDWSYGTISKYTSGFMEKTKMY